MPSSLFIDPAVLKKKIKLMDKNCLYNAISYSHQPVDLKSEAS